MRLDESQVEQVAQEMTLQDHLPKERLQDLDLEDGAKYTVRGRAASSGGVSQASAGRVRTAA